MSFEHLHVYGAALKLRGEVDVLGRALGYEFRDAYRQLDRAVDSIMNNIAEGSASVYPGRRKMFYDIAAGSAREARGIIRSLATRRAFGDRPAFQALTLCRVIGKMLAALIAKLPV